MKRHSCFDGIFLVHDVQMRTVQFEEDRASVFI